MGYDIRRYWIRTYKAASALAAISIAAFLALGCHHQPGDQTDPAVAAVKAIVATVCPNASDPLATASLCVLYLPDRAKVLACIEQACAGAPSPTAVVTPTATVAPPSGLGTPTSTAAPTASPTSATPGPTATSVPAPSSSALFPPTADFVNGCSPGAEPTKSSGECEFNIWLKVPGPGHFPPGFEPPCSPADCPAFWRPSGMALADDHMFPACNEPAARFEPRAGRCVSIIWYVASGRQWIYVGPSFDVHAVFPSHDCVAGETGNCVRWKPRAKRSGDAYNGQIDGHGEYVVCLPRDAYTCRDPKDFDDPQTQITGVCASGTIALPGAGVCRGPYRVDR